MPLEKRPPTDSAGVLGCVESCSLAAAMPWRDKIIVPRGGECNGTPIDVS